MKSISPFFQDKGILFKSFQDHFLCIRLYNAKLYNLFYDMNLPFVTELSYNLELICKEINK